MPWEWIEPEEFLTYRGVRIFHTYEDELSDIPFDFWFSTSSTASFDSQYAFDVRELPGYTEKHGKDERLKHKRVIMAAIDAGLLRSDTPVKLQTDA